MGKMVTVKRRALEPWQRSAEDYNTENQWAFNISVVRRYILYSGSNPTYAQNYIASLDGSIQELRHEDPNTMMRDSAFQGFFPKQFLDFSMPTPYGNKLFTAVWTPTRHTKAPHLEGSFALIERFGSVKLPDVVWYHSTHVREAVEKGKPVPREILEEYKGESWAKAELDRRYPTHKIVKVRRQLR